MFLHYIKFSLFHVLTLFTIVAMLLGHIWIPLAYALISAFVVFGDLLLGDDLSTPEYRASKWMTLQLYIALPLLCLLMFVSVWAVSASDVFGLGAWLTQLTGYDVLAAREQTQLWHLAVGVFFIGLMVSSIGTITGHELVHRTWDNTSVTLGRWMLAFSFDANFSIEHVYGHHRKLGTAEDPATAPRGRNVYQHIIISTVKGNVSAWKIEADRLRRKSISLWSWRNQCIRGYLMSLILLSAAYYIGDLAGLLFFVLCGLWAKCMLEIVNYMEHYGIVRLPNKRVEPRHSWNTNKKISSWAMFNLSRHSHHHAHGQLPFHKLKPYPEAPRMISGYLATVMVTLIPPLWFRLMAPKLEQWDNEFATDAEREILAQTQ